MQAICNFLTNPLVSFTNYSIEILPEGQGSTLELLVAGNSNQIKRDCAKKLRRLVGNFIKTLGLVNINISNSVDNKILICYEK